jgi:hypothetical protein
MGRLEIIHDDVVIFDQQVNVLRQTHGNGSYDLSTEYNPQPEPAVGNLPGLRDDTDILGEQMPGWEPDTEIDDGR